VQDPRPDAGPSLIDRRKLFEQVAAHLEREILDGTLRAGDRLPPERDLRQRFGVGRPAIREALITLQRSGLIEIGNGMPARVSRPTVERVMSGMRPAVQQMLLTADGQRHLQGARLFMEIGLVRHAAVYATDQELDGVQAALDENRAAIGDIERFIATDVAYHFTYAALIGNPVFVALHEAMTAWLEQQRRIALAEPGEDRRGHEAHARVLAAVRSRDPDAAEAAIRDHLTSGGMAFWHRYAAGSGDLDPDGGTPAH